MRKNATNGIDKRKKEWYNVVIRDKKWVSPKGDTQKIA